jgi:hypothetical protein
MSDPKATGADLDRSLSSKLFLLLKFHVASLGLIFPTCFTQ